MGRDTSNIKIITHFIFIYRDKIRLSISIEMKSNTNEQSSTDDTLSYLETLSNFTDNELILVH